MALQPRSYVIEEYTRTVCPACFAESRRRSDDPGVWKDGALVVREGSVWMRRWCNEHGETESLYEEDADLWLARRGWSTPTLCPVPDRPGDDRGFPDAYRDGLPGSHGQHTCILLLNVTEHCNFRCPTCYASALDPGSALSQPLRPSADELLRTVETMIHREGGKISVLMLSGGEPTVRPDIGQLIERLRDLPITRILLNTNGRRIARDDALLDSLRGLAGRLEVYLQFDGMTEATHRALRGEDLTEEKAKVVARLKEADVPTTLVMTATQAVNDHEIGAVATIALDSRNVGGLAIQPVFGSGRNPGFDPERRLTPTGVLRRIEAQTAGRIKASDFIPLPCSHRDCCDIAYFIQDKESRWRSLIDVVGREELRKHLHLVANTIAFEGASDAVKEMVKSGALQRLFSEQKAPRSLDVARDLFRLCGCIPGVAEAVEAIAAKRASSDAGLRELARRTKRFTVKMFMDAHTFHEARIRQCCVHVGTFEEDPRRYSFCWRWLFADATDFPELEPLPMAQ
ncbi:MAG: radical SAM protein [Armatimonadetes bacterium]|nr:radical SAM protein [Armatimonadota bacterium]